MKRFRILMSLVLAVILFASLSIGAFAADGDDSGYMIRVFSGNQGTIGGATVVTNPEDFTLGSVALNDDAKDKYYVKGIRESGKDINPYRTDLPARTELEHDTDYVVVYGLKTDIVTLTIRYVNTNGVQLALDRVLFCNKGDKPLVKALYIDGYAPYYNYITGTLNEDATWTFQYYVPANGGAIVVPGGGANAGGANAGANAGGANAGANAGGANAGTGASGTGTGPADVTTVPPVTQEILDVDVPLAGPTDGQNTQNQGATSEQKEKATKIILKIGLILFLLLILALIIFLYWYFLFYRKKKKSEEENDQN